MGRKKSLQYIGMGVAKKMRRERFKYREKKDINIPSESDKVSSLSPWDLENASGSSPALVEVSVRREVVRVRAR